MVKLNKQTVQKWEKVNDSLVSDIELFYKEYEETHKEEFFRNEFKEHKKMLRISGKIFNRRIDMQVNQLWILNEKMKEDKCLAEFKELTKKVSEEKTE